MILILGTVLWFGKHLLGTRNDTLQLYWCIQPCRLPDMYLAQAAAASDVCLTSVAIRAGPANGLVFVTGYKFYASEAGAPA
jgi:hypothetical protein